MRTHTMRGIVAAAALTVVALGVAGCGSTTDEGTNEPDSGTATDLVYPDETGACAADPLEGVDFDTASALISEFEEESTSLPVTEPLPEPVDPATTVAYLDNGSAVAGIIWAGLEQAAATAGVQLQRVDTGLDAQSINTA